MAIENTPLWMTLQDRGIRLTRQRRVLLEIFESAEGHLSAAELLRRARQRDPTINRATVYRTVALLKRQGLIDELDLLHLSGEEHFYEQRSGHDHVHVGCPGCGRITEMDTELVSRLEAEVRQRTGCEPDSIRIEVRAVCPDCQERRRAAATPEA